VEAEGLHSKNSVYILLKTGLSSVLFNPRYISYSYVEEEQYICYDTDNTIALSSAMLGINIYS